MYEASGESCWLSSRLEASNLAQAALLQGMQQNMALLQQHVQLVQQQ